MLSYGGKEGLLTSFLQSIPIYVLPAIVPPICVIKELHKIFAKFFWSNKNSSRSKHWSAWEKVRLSMHEGGLGLDLCLMFLRLYMLNCGGYLGHKIICGPITYETNIVRSRYLLLFSGKGVHGCGNSCWRIGG